MQTENDSCAALFSCERCIAASTPPGIDKGERCVWCPHESRCRTYHRHSFAFPCAAAMRKGGGYPGGADCRQGPRLSSPSSPAGQSWGAPFSHKPVTREPVAVVIPSFSRPTNLAHSIVWLLQLEPMRRPGSEIIVSHGSVRSLSLAPLVDANVTRLCDEALPPGCAGSATVRHLDSIENNRDVFAAQRYHAARNASSDCNVLIHLDDDLVPSEAMLQALADSVATEKGFPHSARGLYGPSSLGRRCGSSGYATAPSLGASASFFLPAGITATSAAANRAYTDSFYADYRAVLQATKGNGEDLTFAHAVWRRSGRLQEVGNCAGHRALAHSQPKQWRDACGTVEAEIHHVRGEKEDELIAQSHSSAATQYHNRPLHYTTRDQMCRCLASGHLASSLLACVNPAHLSDEL